MFQLESSWHGRSVDHVLTYSGRQVRVGSQKPSQITRQKTCCASESNTSAPVVFANRSGFDAGIRVVKAWEERGSRLNIFQTTNRGRISENLTNYEAKRLVVQSGFDAGIGVVKAWVECGSFLNIFRTKNHGRISETFTNYEAKDLFRNELNTSVRVVFANCSGLDVPIGVVKAWEERGSCLNKFRTTNHGWISETFTNYEAKDLLHKLVKHFGLRWLYLRTVVALMFQLELSRHGRSVDHVLTYSRRQIAVGSLKPSRITRQRTCCASESNSSVRVVFANQIGFDAGIGVFKASEERESCLNIFRTTNHGRPGRSMDHVLTYSERQITVGSKKPSRITRQKICCASESNTSVRIVFANRSGFDAGIGVVKAWEERGSCLNIFWMINHGRILETFTNYEAKDLLRK
ncbi:uncharacterized protein G2W53_009869 [Senna tora]|uniref:Uncharacterized protein n=1 Tax=Senna tora TaxID=362788 RepID=A0A834WY86_9FABA|nr:uncharacterized protein G2W53_009869 [Senna tora]